ncbi:hypothetical protein ACFY12_25330 [Streptomyces sp. NPDC001339]|uniref:hypothetical protein n=1 Tax=Streptomyces sp. NPDC001339 TaxID=3364563 RepID=UPI0036ACB9BA
MRRALTLLAGALAVTGALSTPAHADNRGPGLVGIIGEPVRAASNIGGLEVGGLPLGLLNPPAPQAPGMTSNPQQGGLLSPNNAQGGLLAPNNGQGGLLAPNNGQGGGLLGPKSNTTQQRTVLSPTN